MDKNTAVPIVASVLVIVALVASAAFVFTNDNSKDPVSMDYQIYLEVVGADGVVTSATTIEFTAEKTNEAFVAAANAAFTDAGVNAKFTLGDYLSLSYNGSSNNACYYRSGDEWVSIDNTETQYVNNSELALMLGNGYVSETVYNSLTAAEQAGYKETGYGGAYAYIKLPDANSYEYYIEFVGADGKVTGMKNVAFSISNNSLDTYIDAANAAFTDAGVNAKFTLGDYLSLSYNGSSNNACYYLDGEAWTAIDNTQTQYVENSTVALMLGNGYVSETVYNALSETEQAGYKETGYGGAYAYIKLPDEITYTVAYEVIAADGTVSDNGFVTFNAPRYGLSAYIPAFNKAFSDAGMPAVMTQGKYISIKYNGSSSNACYYYNGAWETVTDTATQYIDNELVGIAFGNGYISTAVYEALPAELQSSYEATGMGFGYDYVKHLDYVNYTVRYEIINDDGSVEDFGDVSFTAPIKSLGYYMPAFNKAFLEADIPLVISQGEYVSLSYNGSGNNACYYYLSGAKTWMTVTDTATQYVDNELVGLALGNGYISAEVYDELSDVEKAGYRDTGYGGAYAYIKLMDDYVYTVLYEVIKADGTVGSTGKVTFPIVLAHNDYFIDGFNKAFADAGVLAVASMGKYGVSIAYDGSGNNACYYFDDLDWVAVSSTSTDYINNQLLGFALGNGYISSEVYDALSAADKAGYKETGYGGAYAYIKLMDSTVRTVYYQIVDGNGVATAAEKIEFITPEDTIECYADMLSCAMMEYAGISVTMDVSGWLVYGEDGENNATYYADSETSTWMEVYDLPGDYIAHDTVALMLGNGYISESIYNALTAEQKAGFKNTGYGGDYDYIKIPEVTLA